MSERARFYAGFVDLKAEKPHHLKKKQDRFNVENMATAGRRQMALAGVNPLCSIPDWAKARIRPG